MKLNGGCPKSLLLGWNEELWNVNDSQRASWTGREETKKRNDASNTMANNEWSSNSKRVYLLEKRTNT